jgi:hypothetical protein
MYLSDVLKWIKQNFQCAAYYSGRADTNKDEYLALYDITPSSFSGIAIGSASLLSYDQKVVKFILRYGQNSDSAEKKARELFNLFLPAFEEQPKLIGEHRIISFLPTKPRPLGTDERGNFEYSLDVTITFERS